MESDKQKLLEYKQKILQDSKSVASFVTIGKTLYDLYYVDKLVKNQKEFLAWTKQNLSFSKSTTYEYIISYRVYNEIIQKLPPEYEPPLYQSHCQLLAKVPDDQVCEVWIKVCQRANNGNITTSMLEQLMQEMNFKPLKNTSNSGGSRKKRVVKKESSDEEMDSEIESPSKSVKYDEEDAEAGYATPEPVVPMPVLQTPPKKRLGTLRKKLPFDQEYIYELAKSVTTNNQFDHQSFSASEFLQIEQQEWFGSIYCDLSELKPFSRNFKDGIERYLQIIFTRYANKLYNEGLFIIRAEFGADWFTPILQHPFCILRQRLEFTAGEYESYIAFYMGVNTEAFCSLFRNVGFIPGYNIWYSILI